MKKVFSTAWVSSKKPRKQRKYRANAPLHIRKKMMKSLLSKELRKKYGKKSITPRKEDTVKIMRGENKKKSGKIMKVDLKKIKLQIEGVEILKRDGSKKHLYIDPSNVMITQLNLSDKLRKEKLEKKQNG